MKKKILNFLDRRPLIWFHYVLLVVLLYGSWYLGDIIFAESFIEFWIMAPWLFIWLSIGDQLIHAMIGVD